MSSNVVCDNCMDEDFYYDSTNDEYSCNGCGEILTDESKIFALQECDSTTEEKKSEKMSDYPMISFVGTFEILQRQGHSHKEIIENVEAQCASCRHSFTGSSLYEMVNFVHEKQQGYSASLMSNDFSIGTNYQKIQCKKCHSDRMDVTLTI